MREKNVGLWVMFGKSFVTPNLYEALQPILVVNTEVSHDNILSCCMVPYNCIYRLRVR